MVECGIDGLDGGSCTGVSAEVLGAGTVPCPFIVIRTIFSRSVHQDVILLYLSGERSPVADRALRFNIWEAMSLHGLLLYLAHLLSFPWSPSIHRLQPGSCLLIVQHADTLSRKRTSTGGGGSRRLITIIC